MILIISVVLSFAVGFVWAWQLRGFTLRKEIAQRNQLAEETRELLKDVNQQTTTNQNLIQRMKTLQKQISWQVQMSQPTDHDRWIN